MRGALFLFLGLAIGLISASILLIPHEKSQVLGTHTVKIPTPTVTPIITPYK